MKLGTPAGPVNCGSGYRERTCLLAESGSPGSTWGIFLTQWFWRGHWNGVSGTSPWEGESENGPVASAC